MKTTTRFATKNSICACISNLAYIVSTHFIPVQYKDSDIRAEIKYCLNQQKCCLKGLHGVRHSFPVLQELIILTNDTTKCIFKGTVNEQPTFVLATKMAVSKHGTNSLYRVENSKSMKSLQVKLRFTFTAVGNCFLLVVTLVRHRVKEMLWKDFVNVQIPRLCTGGGNCNAYHSQLRTPALHFKPGNDKVLQHCNELPLWIRFITMEAQYWFLHSNLNKGRSSHKTVPGEYFWVEVSQCVVIHIICQGIPGCHIQIYPASHFCSSFLTFFCYFGMLHHTYFVVLHMVQKLRGAAYKSKFLSMIQNKWCVSRRYWIQSKGLN